MLKVLSCHEPEFYCQHLQFWYLQSCQPFPALKCPDSPESQLYFFISFTPTFKAWVPRHWYNLRWFAALFRANFLFFVSGCFGTKMGPSTLKLDWLHNYTYAIQSHSSFIQTESDWTMLFAWNGGFMHQPSVSSAEIIRGQSHFSTRS